MLRGQSAHDEAADDGGVGRALDQRVAGDQLLAPEVIGQNAVFDRTEQRGDAAEPEQGQIEQRQRREGEAGRPDRLNEHLGELQPPGDGRLVVRIGDLAAERRERNRRQHESHRGDQDLHAAALAAEAEKDQHDEHVADEIVVEGGEELAPEQRREPPRSHQGAEHDRASPALVRGALGRQNPPPRQAARAGPYWIR